MLVAGNTVETADLVVALRDFIREALGLAPVPPSLAIPRQGPTRLLAKGGKEGGGKDEGKREGGMGSGQDGGGSGHHVDTPPREGDGEERR
jgi:hypothetical protein